MIRNRSIFLVFALILCECFTVVVALTVGVRHEHHRKVVHSLSTSTTAQYLNQRSCGFSVRATCSSYLQSSSSNDAGSLIHDKITNVDPQTMQGILSSFRDWYSTTASQQMDSTTLTLISFLADDVQWADCHYSYQPLLGIDVVERHLRLQKLNLLNTVNAAITMVIDEVVTTSSGDDFETTSVGFTFHMAERTNGSAEGMVIPNRRGIVVVDLKQIGSGYSIIGANIVREKSSKTGEFGLTILSIASNFIRRTSQQQSKATANNKQIDAKRKVTLAEQYFDAWNRRDMESAVSVFADDISYDDTAFPQPFIGKDNLRQHLLKCAQCFPETFQFRVDRVLEQQAEDVPKLIVAWHVENDNVPLPFTNGISYYEIDPLTQTISKGIDYVDSESIKVASILDPIIALYQFEPIRLVPTVIWFAYMYVVFVSEGILPGANALQLETRTWEEVRDLSLNFFLVAPTLHLSFSPSVHPMLEGVFNVLLSWAAMFAGFLSDDRREKPNLLPMLPIVIGMQFLTSAFLLPYLATRTPERYMTNNEKSTVTSKILDTVSTITESRILGSTLALVGLYSILWALIGRWEEFGGFAERYQSFIDLLSIDRVGSSFIVDLIVFALFQGWFVDDDMQRRNVPVSEMKQVRWFGKYVPFFGMAAYLAFRPSFDDQDDNIEIF